MSQDPVDAYNDYPPFLAEYGVVCEVLLLLFLGAHLQNGWRNFRRLGPKRVVVSNQLLSNSLALNLGALGAVAAYLMHSFVDFNLHIPANVLLLAFVFGVLTNAGVQREGEDSAVRLSILCWRALLKITGGFVAIQSFRVLHGEYFPEHPRWTSRTRDPRQNIRFASLG